jgi:hypothetical protein
MLFVLLFFGGESIYNFVLAMLIGIASGLYSSIFNASMVLVAWNRWDEKKQGQARPVRGAATPARAATATSSTRAGTSPAGSAATAPRRTTFASTAAPTASTPAVSTPTVSTSTTPAPSTSAVTQPLTDSTSVAGPDIEVVPSTSPASASGMTDTVDTHDGAGDVSTHGGLEDGAAASDSDQDDYTADDAATQTSSERGSGAARSAPVRKSRAKRRF